jgi:hypothetical protein
MVPTIWRHINLTGDYAWGEEAARLLRSFPADVGISPQCGGTAGEDNSN